MPRKTLRQRRNPTDDNSNRVRGIVDAMDGFDKPEDIMKAIQATLSGTSKTSVVVGNLYTFVYSAKTPGIIFDPYPLVGVEKVFSWGFIGINLHWSDRRQYTWNEIVGNVYEVYEEERVDMERLSYGDFEQRPSK